MVKESKHCSDVMKKHFNKELVMTKNVNSTKCLICDNHFVDGDAKVRDHCHIAGKYKSPAQRDCNIKVKFNHNISVNFTT